MTTQDELNAAAFASLNIAIDAINEDGWLSPAERDGVADEDLPEKPTLQEAVYWGVFSDDPIALFIATHGGMYDELVYPHASTVLDAVNNAMGFDKPADFESQDGMTRERVLSMLTNARDSLLPVAA